MMIAEVSKKFDISIQTLRYYERIGLIPPVNRDTNGIRDYAEQDCDWVEDRMKKYEQKLKWKIVH